MLRYAHRDTSAINTGITLAHFTYRIEVFTQGDHLIQGDHVGDAAQAANRFVEAAHQLNIENLTGCFAARLYFLHGAFTPSQLDEIARLLLADTVTEQYVISPIETPYDLGDAYTHHIEVATLPGVTNAVADNLAQRVRQLGIGELAWAAVGDRYALSGELKQDELHQLAENLFANVVIHQYTIDAPIVPQGIATTANDTVETVPVQGIEDEGLLQISQERRLALDLNEMRAIRDYFEEEKRDPTDLEIEMIAQTWSEHCVHKTFRATIDYDGPQGKETIHGLLKQYIRAATEKLDKPWLRSVFVDNAGIIRFDDQYDLAFKVETHNRPSAIEPFGGANTGVGGVVRDVLGVSAKPIANTDVLCFGPQDTPLADLPAGVLPPRRIADGVIAGVEDYGNKMGIPTVNGAVLYHEGYLSNPLVFCGCLGILPHDSHTTEPQPGDYIVVIGGRTGRDGLRGATFSSMEMDATTGTVAGSSVQIGNPITEKQVQEVILRARDEGLYSAITDCGAGGLSSAVGEMAKEIGATVQLDDIPLKYPGLQPWEIWLSEAQERMVLAVPPQYWERLQAICATQDVEAVNIGSFVPDGRLKVLDGERVVGDMAMIFLHDGIPTRQLAALWQPATVEEAATPEPTLQETLPALLAHPNIRSKETIVRLYDHEIQGASHIKPFTGPQHDGHNDGAVLVPIGTQDKTRGVVLSNGICPQYTDQDPYAMAFAAVDEAVRNAVAVGADPDQIAILDNFSWGNANLPDRLGSLVRCVQGCHDAAMAYGTPYISGKDSLNNEYTDAAGNRHAIPGTLLISAVGIVPDVHATTTSDFKQAGHAVYVVGQTRTELGGSHYGMVTGRDYAVVPQPVEDALTTMRAMHQAIREGLVAACHDVSEGGLAVALAEMAIGGNVGFTVNLCQAPGAESLSDAAAAFSESIARFVVEVPTGAAAQFEQLFGQNCRQIGETTASATCIYEDTSGESRFTVAELRQSWRGDDPTQTKLDAPAALSKVSAPAVKTTRPRVLILHANGTNRDHDVALACELVGAEPEIVHINQLRQGEKQFSDYAMLVVPGGFSYGDDLGAGRLWSLDLRYDFAEQMDAFVASGKPVIGICNGFQTLVKSGLLPGGEFSGKVTLTYNAREHFECRWVYLEANPNSPNLFTQGIEGLIHCPVAHGEGRVMTDSAATTDALLAANLNALNYVHADGSPAGPSDYPANPNGSIAGIAGLSNAAGNVLGLMPHPENHIFPWQHPQVRRGIDGGLGLSLFINGVQRA